MVKRIFIFLMLPSMIIAIFLSLSGVNSLPLGSAKLWNFFKVVAMDYSRYSFGIPSIPKISHFEYLTKESGFLVVLNALIWIGNGLINLVNTITAIFNFVGTIVNILIDLLVYLFSFIVHLKDLRNILISASVFI